MQYDRLINTQKREILAPGLVIAAPTTIAIAQLIADLARPVVDNGVERQRRIAIPTDSQDQAEALERFIRECYPHLLVVPIDSTTTETDEGRSFVERPNEKLTEIKPDVLIYTSSMGVSVICVP